MNGKKEDLADAKIRQALSAVTPKNFFLLAGAGSGKTTSLIRALDYIRSSRSESFDQARKRVAVITYTNAAADEIRRRLGLDPLVDVSTIHSFAWRLVREFPDEIRAWLQINLNKKIARLEDEQKKGRPSAASDERTRKLRKANARLDRLPGVTRFVYSPSQAKISRDGLDHAEVLAVASYLLMERPALRTILIGRYPVLFIDEAQDTNKGILSALLFAAKEGAGSFSLGLFGDTMQRIYGDGLENLEESLDDEWLKLEKTINYRSRDRIVRLGNSIRASGGDKRRQTAGGSGASGTVRLFLATMTADTILVENQAKALMGLHSGDEHWVSTETGAMSLILEHALAAHRRGFENVMEAFRREKIHSEIFNRSTKNPTLSFCSGVLRPLFESIRTGKRATTETLLRRHSPLAQDAALRSSETFLSSREKISKAVNSLKEILERPEATMKDAIHVVDGTRLLEVPDVLTNSSGEVSVEDLDTNYEARHRSAWTNALNVNFKEFDSFLDYTDGLSEIDTQQGVKGLEFPRVMVVLDDSHAGGNSFNYDKVFGARQLTSTDTQNISDGKDSTLARTLRLLYVACTRAEESLAVVMYTDNPEAARATAMKNEWFEEHEILTLPSQQM